MSPTWQWERFGERDPFYAVITADEYRRENLTPRSLDRFFESGESELDDALEAVRRHVGAPFIPRRALDFGCGVGRVLIPLAARCDSVVGVDVSGSMLGAARRECEKRGVVNVELIHSAALDRLAPDFDFIWSVNVFQHVPTRTGYRLLAELVRLLRPGGVAALHFAVRPRHFLAIPFFWTLKTIPFAANVWNLLKGREWSYPHMQMNVYDVSRMRAILAGAGCPGVEIAFVPAGGRFADYHGVRLIFRREGRTGR